VKIRSLWLAVAACIAVGATIALAQAEDERRAAIRVLRAINTAENAVKSRGGAYQPIAELLDHPMMGGVKADFAVNGNSVTYAGSQLRLALSADASQYVVTVVWGAPSYTAAFTDERGLIYTGKALE
jgi:hypothetical protein